MSLDASAAVAEPVVVPAADQPPGDAKPLGFNDRWKAAEANEPDADDAPPAPKPAAAKPPAADKRSQLESLAKELGLSLNGDEVTVAERAEFRRAKEKREAEWERRERAITEKETSVGSNEKVKRADAIFDAIERGDPDAFAKAVNAKDFNDFQTSFIKRLADPNYAELQRLQKRVEEADELKKQQEEQQRQNENNAARARAYSSYMSTLSETCKASANPLVAAMHDDPLFLQAVYNIQEQSWDKELERTCTVEEAIAKASKGAKSPLKNELRELYNRLHKGFGADVAGAAVEAAQKAGGKRPAPKTAVTPAHSTNAGGPPKPIGEMTPNEWAEYKKKRYAEEAEG